MVATLAQIPTMPHAFRCRRITAFTHTPARWQNDRIVICATVGIHYLPSSVSILRRGAAYLPPSPPNSEPGSPDRRKELIQNLSPPPSYAASMASKMAGLTPGPALSVQTQAVPAQFNRRNNPDLDKRRIHHCDVQGEIEFNI